METWLKAECHDTGMAYIAIATLVDNIAEEMVVDKAMVPSYKDMLSNTLGKLVDTKRIEKGEDSEIMAVAEGHISSNDAIKLGDYADHLYIKALEKTVVCQIGERGYGKPRSDTERAMAHYGITEEEYLANPEKYPLPERGTGLEEAKPTEPSILKDKWYDKGVEAGKTDTWMDIENTIKETAERHPEITDEADLIFEDVEQWKQTDHYQINYGRPMWNDVQDSEIYPEVEVFFWNGYVTGRKQIGKDIYEIANELVKGR